MEITEIKTLLKSSEFEEFIQTKSTFLQTDESKTVFDTDGNPEDDFKVLKQSEPILLNPEWNKEVQLPTSLVKPHQNVYSCQVICCILTSPILNT